MPEVPLTMPKMSMTMEEGIMVSWLKQPGDQVKVGEAVAEVTTDKVDMEVESPHAGTLARIVAEPEDVVAVGEPIGYIDSDEEDLLGDLFGGDEDTGASTEDAEVDHGEPGEGHQEAAPAEETADQVSTSPQVDAQESDSDWPAAAPAARLLADAFGMDIAKVPATGKWGSVTVPDVEKAHAQAPQSDAPAAGEPKRAASAPLTPSADLSTALHEAIAALSALAKVVDGQQVAKPAAAPAAPQGTPLGDPKRRRVRQQVAKVMSASAAVPQFTAWAELDLTAAQAARKGGALNGISWTAVLLKAQAVALSRTPALLGHWADDQVVADDGIHVAMAIDGPTGLLAPVLNNPHERPLSEVAEEIVELVTQVREGALKPDRLAGGTTVFSNLGGFGVDVFNALITPPHATALSVGSVQQKLHVYEDGQFAPRLSCTVGLTIDHRVADGADGGRYLQALREVLAAPEQLA